MDLRVGIKAKVTALTIGTYYLSLPTSLPTSLIIELNDCCFMPTNSKNIISISFLDKKGFSFLIKDKSFFYLSK